MAWLEDGEFVLDHYQPTLDEPLPLPPGGGSPIYTAIDAPQGLPWPGERMRLADREAGVPTRFLPVTREEMDRWPLCRDLVRGLADPPPLAYSARVWFIETPVFSSQLYALLSDDDFRALQLALALRPEQGALIPGGGGLRKLRWGQRGRGKRGGLRLIYYWAPGEDGIYLLFLYPKNRQEDLTPEQLKLLKKIVQEDLK